MNPTNLDVVQRSQKEMVTLNREASTAGGGSILTTGMNGEHPGFFNPNAMTKSGMIHMK